MTIKSWPFSFPSRLFIPALTKYTSYISSVGNPSLSSQDYDSPPLAAKYLSFGSVSDQHLEIMELKPGESLGPYTLGTTLLSTLEHIRADPSLRCTVAWDITDPAAGLRIILQHPPLELLFSPMQRLINIQLDCQGPVDTLASVHYRHKSLRQTEDSEAVLTLLRRVMGPTVQPLPVKSKVAGSVIPRVTLETRPVAAMEKEEVEVMSYPGVVFCGINLTHEQGRYCTAILSRTRSKERHGADAGEPETDSKLLRISVIPPPPLAAQSTGSMNANHAEKEEVHPYAVVQGDLKLATIHVS